MIKRSTYIKIRSIEVEFGSLINALEECQINKSNYYRWRKISMSQGYIDFLKK